MLFEKICRKSTIETTNIHEIIVIMMGESFPETPT